MKPLSGDASALSSRARPGAWRRRRARATRARPHGRGMFPVTLGAGTRSGVRFAIGDALRLASAPGARHGRTPAAARGEQRRGQVQSRPDPTKPPGSFFPTWWTPPGSLRSSRGTPGRATGEGLPRVSPGLASATRKTPDRRRRRASCCAWSAVAIPAIVARPAARAAGDRVRDRDRDLDRDLPRDRFSGRGRRR